MINQVSVEKLAEFPDFQIGGFRRKFGVELSLDAVMASEPLDYVVDEERGESYHLGRVRWFMENWDDEPIDIDSDCSGGVIHPVPILLDGNHRFFAALLGGRKSIGCIFSGLTSLLDHLSN